MYYTYSHMYAYIRTFSPFLTHTPVQHDRPTGVYKMLTHALPFQTPDWTPRSRFDFLLKGLFCWTTFAYEIKYVQYRDLI